MALPSTVNEDGGRSRDIAQSEDPNGAISALSVGLCTDAPFNGRRCINRQAEDMGLTALARRSQFFGRPTRTSVAILQHTDAHVGLTEGNVGVLVF